IFHLFYTYLCFFFFFQAEDGIRDFHVTGVQTCALPIYGSMENLLANTHELKGKMRENIEANKELGLMSKALTTIMLNVPVEFHEEDFEMSEPDMQRVEQIFEVLEFRQMLSNFHKTFSVQTTTVSIETDGTTVKETVQVTKISSPAGAGQFSLFDTDAKEVSTVSNYSGRLTAKTNPHFYQTIATGMATKLFIQNLMKQTSVCF